MQKVVASRKIKRAKPSLLDYIGFAKAIKLSGVKLDPDNMEVKVKANNDSTYTLELVRK